MSSIWYNALSSGIASPSKPSWDAPGMPFVQKLLKRVLLNKGFMNVDLGNNGLVAIDMVVAAEAKATPYQVVSATSRCPSATDSQPVRSR
jgi:hypothetical protein